jgi:hypothetical protein
MSHAGRLPLRLPVGRVAVLLGSPQARAELMAALDDAGGRCAEGHSGVPVRRVRSARDTAVDARRDALAEAGRERATIVLVDRLTDGLSARERRAVLGEARAVAATGAAVLVDDAEPVAALAYADVALRVGPDGAPALEELDRLGAA